MSIVRGAKRQAVAAFRRTFMGMVVAAATSAIACGGATGPKGAGGGNNGLVLGTFHAVVSGAVSDTLDGSARFELYAVTGTCSIVLDASSNTNGISILTSSGGRPVQGQVDFDATYLDHRAAVIGYGADGGTITIATSVSTELSGTMAFTGHQTYPSEDPGRTISVTGSFRAGPGQAPCS